MAVKKKQDKLAKEPASANFKARIECSLLRGIASSISMLTDEAKFKIGKKKWVIQVVDPAHIAMLELEIDVSNFEDYICKKEGVVGVDIDKLHDAIKYVKDRDIVRIETDILKVTREKEGKDVVVNIDRIKIDDGLCSRRFNQPDTLGMSEPKVPNLNLKSNFEMTWVDFGDALKRFQKISDHVKIACFEEGIELSVEGDIDECVVKKPKDLLVSYEFGGVEDETRKDHIRSLYPLDYMTSPFKSSKMSGMSPLFKHERWLNVCKFSLSDDYPIKIEAQRNGVSITYLLAPRIESE